MKPGIRLFLFNIISYIINNPEQCVLKFSMIFFSILFTALLGWIVYKKQQKIKYVQEDITNFFYVFYLIIKNYEEIINMYTQYAQKAREELSNAIQALDAVKIIGDKYHNKTSTSDVIQLSESAKEEILLLELQKQMQYVNLSISSYRYYWFINEKDFSKEALFLTKYGDGKFQAIAARLHSVYKILNELNSSILRDIDESRTKPSTYHNEVFVCDIRENNYEEQIFKYRSRLSYKLSLFDTLSQELEKGIIYSRNALEHLQCFYNAFQKTYKHQLKFIGVKYKEFGLANEILDESEYKRLLSARKSFEVQYWDIPDFEKILR